LPGPSQRMLDNMEAAVRSITPSSMKLPFAPLDYFGDDEASST
jgi:hypothetical protein